MKWSQIKTIRNNSMYGIHAESVTFNVYLHRNRKADYFWYSFSEKPENDFQETEFASGKLFFKDTKQNFEIARRVVDKIAEAHESGR